MQYFLAILAFPFLYWNYKILDSDIKNQKIPNKYLGYLLGLVPVFYLGLFVDGGIGYSDISGVLLHTIIACIVSIGLYWYGIWSAGDAKYLLTLSLFIPLIGIGIFIGNLALLTLGSLILYFLYFYLIKFSWNRERRKNLLKSINQDLTDKLNNFKTNNTFGIFKKSILLQIAHHIYSFLVIFVILRLLRLYFIQELQEKYTLSEYISHSFTGKHVYILFIIIGMVFALFYGFKIIMSYIRKKMAHILGKRSAYAGVITLIITSFCLLGYIIYELIESPYEIKESLQKIFIIYLSIYFCFSILRYSYKITFQIGEEAYVPLPKISEGMIVDKSALVQSLGNIYALGANGNTKGYLYPNPKSKILEINKILQKNDILFIKKIISIANKNIGDNKKFSEINTVKIVKSFSFGPYIFLGFMITFFLGNALINGVIGGILKIIHYI